MDQDYVTTMELILEDVRDADVIQTLKFIAVEASDKIQKKMSEVKKSNEVVVNKRVQPSDREIADLVTREVVELCREVSLSTTSCISSTLVMCCLLLCYQSDD